MRKLFLITLSLLIVSEVWSLEPCPDNQPKEKWDNCTGTVTDSSGKYSGEWKDGKTHGLGTFTYTDGAKYVGVFKDSLRNGQGTYIWAGGAKYVGEWKDNKRNGLGTLTLTNGEKMVGEWKDSKVNGQATWTHGNAKYVGEWQNSTKHGHGTYTCDDGRVYEGRWRRNKLVRQTVQQNCYSESNNTSRYMMSTETRDYNDTETREVIFTALFDRCSEFGWQSDADISACIKQEAYLDLQMQEQQYEMRLLEERLIGATTPEPRPFFLDLLNLYAQTQQLKQTQQMQKDIQRLKASQRSMRSRQNTQRALKFLYQGRGG